jgi:SNF2 family DNA or RNA helicase
MVKTNLNCTRVPSPKPGMQSLWGASYQPGIKIVLKRQVGEKSLKIQAYDYTREIIGMVESSSAAALTPLLDTNIHLRTDCRIPPHPKRPGEEPGQVTSQSYSLDVIMYGPLRYARSVGVHLHKHSLRLLAPHMVQKGIKVHNPHAIEYRPPVPRVYQHDGPSASAPPSSRTVEEVRSEVMGVFDSLTRNEDLSSMDPDPCVTTPLLTHQKQGLFFMMQREKPRDLHANDKAMVSFWQTKAGPGGQKLYHNVITGQTQKMPPPETRGGILADMMGLGKTLSILSLVAATRGAASQWEVLPPVQPSAPETKPSRPDGLPAQPNLGLTPLTRNVRSTLLICPLSTVSNWEEQVKQHFEQGSLTYHVYHGSNRIKDPAKLAAFDIVITTYGSVSNELSSRRKGKDGSYPLEEIGWFRIVLDEAHMIREQSTLQFKAICRLQAERRWAVTGTPVQNRLDDLAALLAFLRLHPFDDRGKFLRHIVEPFKACDPEIVPKLRVLVDTITLRRLKDKIDLPPREDLVVKLDFSPEERTIYELFARNAQNRVKVLAGSDNEKALGGNTYIHILKSILRLRLLCAHGKDLLNEEDLATLQGMSAEMAIDIDDDDENDRPALSDQEAHEMFTLMQETNNDACIECSKKLGSGDASGLDSETQDDVLGFMTPCFHVVCRNCIRNYQERARAMMHGTQHLGPCPVCHTVVRHEFVELRRKDLDVEHDGPARSKSKGNGKRFDKYDGPHTKTRALLEDLIKSKEASDANPSEPPYKSVVFSGWTSHLDLIELALKSASITFTRLDGSMSRTARTAAMDAFRDDPAVHVILVSIMAGGLGLNLTAGNNVYVMEPQYNPAAEAQAVDRVHRLGQKRPVRTIRYIMRDSFEEKMLELQEKKVKLASLSMDGRSKGLDKAEAARQKLMDLRSLFK